MNFPIDKQAHFFSGCAGTAVLYSVMGFWCVPLVAFAAYGKESWDKRGHGVYDLHDLYASAAGAVVGAVLRFVLG